jgi:hypothetical protein
MTLNDFMVANPLFSNYYDINNTGGFSTDYIGGSVDYAAATTYAQRETIWKAHEAHIRGLLYALTNESDTRVTAALKSAINTYGFAADHYLDPHPNDQLYWPTQLYVRSMRRLVGDLVWSANDLCATDGTTPRSTKTIATASYVCDLHHNQRFADNYTGSSWRIWNEGNVQAGNGGTDLISPIPLEIVLPKAAEVTNLGVGFAVSSTALAFGAIRMELSSMQIAESLAYVCKQAIDSNIDMQSVDYSALRTAILAAPDGTPPVLPQVN